MSHSVHRSGGALFTAIVVLMLPFGGGCGGTMNDSAGAGSGSSGGTAPEALDATVADALRTGMESGSKSFDHSTFDALLSKHVDAESGRVDYRGLKEDRGQLEAYLDRLAGAKLRELSRDAQLALLINAYNAHTLALIVRNYPVDSIKDLSDPWSTPRHEVGGHELSLDEIEHGLIRPLYRDPRIHFAVNCAAVDCPYLADFAYRGDRIDEQLEQKTRETLRNEQFARVEGESLRYTRVMKWYRFDFVDESFDGSAENVAQFIARYAGDDVRSFVESRGRDPKTEPLGYDWSLNDTD